MGPMVFSAGASTHIQLGSPMIPMLPGRSSGTIPMLIALRFIESIAC